MKRQRYSDEQIAFALRQTESLFAGWPDTARPLAGEAMSP